MHSPGAQGRDPGPTGEWEPPEVGTPQPPTAAPGGAQWGHRVQLRAVHLGFHLWAFGKAGRQRAGEEQGTRCQPSVPLGGGWPLLGEAPQPLIRSLFCAGWGPQSTWEGLVTPFPMNTPPKAHGEQELTAGIQPYHLLSTLSKGAVWRGPEHPIWTLTCCPSTVCGLAWPRSLCALRFHPFPLRPQPGETPPSGLWRPPP